MPGRQLRIDEFRIEEEPYYLATGDELAIAGPLSRWFAVAFKSPHRLRQDPVHAVSGLAAQAPAGDRFLPRRSFHF